MKNRLLPIALLVIFLVSLFPAALAEENTNTENTGTASDTNIETGSESELQNTDSADCWSDKPDYQPGVDKGFFIWQGKCGNFWWIDWSGDTKAKWKEWYKRVHKTEPTTEEPTSDEVAAVENAATAIDANTLPAEEVNKLKQTGEITTAVTISGIRNAITANKPSTTPSEPVTTSTRPITAEKKLKIKKPELMYKVKGKITSNGQIFDVGLRKFDKHDKIMFKPYANVITFQGWVGPHFDGIFFKTAGDQVTFDLEFDGQKSTELIYIGKDKKNPGTNPFTLTGEPATTRICPAGSVIYNKECVEKVASIAVTPEGISGEQLTEPATKEPTIQDASKKIEDGTATANARIKGILAKLPETAKANWKALNAKRIASLANLQELKAKPEFANFKKELDFKVRQLNTETLKKVKQDYENAKQNLAQAIKTSKQAHEKFLEAKQELKACKENCGELEAKTLEQAKASLTSTVDSMINNLQGIKNKAGSSEDVTNEEAAEITAKIDAEIKELEDAKAKVAAITTKAELKEITKTILEAWKNIKSYTYLHAGEIVNAKQGGIIVKLGHLELRLQKVLEKMEENGKDTSKIQPLVDNFHTELESAKGQFELAEQKFAEFKALPEPKGETGNTLIKEAQGYMKEARKHIQEAHDTLKEITKAIKEAKGAEELATTTAEEAESTTASGEQ